MRIEARRATADRGRQIKAETIYPAPCHPAPQRGERHVHIDGPVQCEAIAGAHVVDVTREIPRDQSKVRSVVEPAERQRRPKFVALAAVVEDDVEDRLHVSRMQRVRRLAHLRPTARRQARIGRAQDHGVITPGVGESERRQMTLVDERVGRHDFDAGDAERRQMRDDRGLRESGEATARGLRDIPPHAGKAAYVEFVENRAVPFDALPARLALGRRRSYAFGGERSAVRAMREHRRVQPVGAVDRSRIRVAQQLGDVEPMALRGLEGTIDAEAVSRSRTQPRDLAAMDAVVAGRQPHTAGLMLAGLVIEAEIGGARMHGVERDVGAVRGEGYSERFGEDIFDVVEHAIPPSGAVAKIIGSRAVCQRVG